MNKIIFKLYEKTTSTFALAISNLSVAFKAVTTILFDLSFDSNQSILTKTITYKLGDWDATTLGEMDVMTLDELAYTVVEE